MRERIFKQIIKISPIAMVLSVSVCLFRTGRTLAKIKHVKMTCEDFDICHRMASSKIVLRYLDYIFDSKCLLGLYVKFVCFLCRRATKIMKKSAINNSTFAIECRKSRFSSPHLGLHFQFKIFKMWNSFVFVCCRKLKLWTKNSTTHSKVTIERR